MYRLLQNPLQGNSRVTFTRLITDLAPSGPPQPRFWLPDRLVPTPVRAAESIAWRRSYDPKLLQPCHAPAPSRSLLELQLQKVAAEGSCRLRQTVAHRPTAARPSVDPDRSGDTRCQRVRRMRSR